MVKALVSASTVAATIRAQADRMHDQARRLGASGEQATVATRAAADRLVDDLRSDPAEVRDLVGALFLRTRTHAEAIRTTRRVGRAAAPPPGASEAAGSAARQTVLVESALESLPDEHRVALLVRDAYGLTVHQAAVALGQDPQESAHTVAVARLALVAATENTEPLSLAGHDTGVGDLGQLADGSAPPGGRFATLRRHVAGCAACASVLGAQTRATAMLSALPLLALDGAAREDLFRATDQHAADRLPTEVAVRRQLEEGTARRPVVAPWVSLAVLVVALLVGGGIGALLADRHTGGGDAAAVATPSTAAVTTTSSGTPPTPVPASPSLPRSTSVAPTPTRSPPRPIPATPTVTNPPAQTSTPTPSVTAPRVPALAVGPVAGPAGTRIAVSGSGFPAGAVIVTYAAGTGTSALAVASPGGSFRAVIVAGGGIDTPEPAGIYVVTARSASGLATANTTFTQTTTG